MFTRTKFTDVPVGHLFWAHNRLWARTSHEGASNVSKYGACNFTIDPEDEYVLAVNGIKLEMLLKKTYPEEVAS